MGHFIQEKCVFPGKKTPLRGMPKALALTFQEKYVFSGENAPARDAEGTRPYFSGKDVFFRKKTPLRGMPQALALTLLDNDQ